MGYSGLIGETISVRGHNGDLRLLQIVAISAFLDLACPSTRRLIS